MEGMLDYLPSGIIIFQGREPFEIVYVNDGFRRMSHYEEMDLARWRSGLWKLLHEEDRGLVKVALREASRSRYTDEFEIRIRSKNGEYRWYVFHMSRANGQSGEPLIAMAITDIHERKQMEEELYIQMERYKLLELLTGELPFDLDVESGEVLVSRKYLELCGMGDTLEHFAKRPEMDGILHKGDIDKFWSAMEEASIQERNAAMELRIKISGNGSKEEYKWYRLNYKSVPGMNGKVIRVVGRMLDVNEEKEQTRRLAEQVKRDSLTGLYNRAATAAEIGAYLEACPDVCHGMLVIDIDNFKDMNDTFGHLFGDTVLTGIAEKISRVFRPEDIIGRVGGDEFLVLMKDVKEEEVLAKAKKLCGELWKNYQGKRQEVEIGCSVGISFYRKDGNNYEELFEKADLAMYQAKESGKNCFKVAGKNTGKAGMRPRKKRDEKIQTVVKVQDESFLSAAFSLLADAKEIDSSLQLLLDRIGYRYGLDMVVVLEDLENGQEFIKTNAWNRNIGTVNIEARAERYENWKPYMSGFDERGLLSIDNSNRVEEEHKALSAKSKEQAHTLVNCCFLCQDGKMGMVIFGSVEKERVWSEFEKETFLEVSKIISVFVSLSRNQRENENTIESLRSCDPLTGLYNEKAFRRIAQEKISNPEPGMQYAVVYTDIREFSYVNDNYGLEAGNQILKEFAQVVSSDRKMISARFHSDLFISLAWDDSKDSLKEIVERTIMGFSKMQQEKFPDRKLSLIAGIYFIEDKNEDIDTAIENSNLTRKRMKQNHTNTACEVYTKDLREQREAEKRIINEFEPALAQRHFKVFIQPKFLLQSMGLSGGEALVRWQKPDGTMVFPDQFIPVLEQSGAIVRLDFFVFEEVLKYMKKWSEEGKELHRISVNFSRKHFEGKGIYKRICELTDAYQIEHRYIEVEITESMLVSGLNIVQTEMELLREAGFSVAIDDFGTGYSSLSMLHDMPADVVKMDKSFLDKNDMEEEKEFIERIGALIRSVKEEIIFEGVETPQQVEFLVDCGFRYGQGYLYDRPLPIQVFEEKYMN